jgi:hypothetical protein
MYGVEIGKKNKNVFLREYDKGGGYKRGKY